MCLKCSAYLRYCVSTLSLDQKIRYLLETESYYNAIAQCWITYKIKPFPCKQMYNTKMYAWVM